MRAKWFLACLLLSSSIAVAAPTHKKSIHHKAGKAKAVKVSKTIKPVKVHAAAEDGRLHLGSAVAMIVDQKSGEALFSRNAANQAPSASITKLMTAMVVLDAGLCMDEAITITEADVDWLRNSGSTIGGSRMADAPAEGVFCAFRGPICGPRIGRGRKVFRYFQ